MMTGLRRAESGPGHGQAPLGPAPGLADIDLSAFRIIQEAVTNVVRHAGTSQCRVVIDQQDGQPSIEVTDNGRGGGVAGTGYGITGMRERAALLGGTFPGPASRVEPATQGGALRIELDVPPGHRDLPSPGEPPSMTISRTLAGD